MKNKGGLWFQTLNEGRTWSLDTFLEENLCRLKTWRNAPVILESELKIQGIDLLCLSHEDLVENHDETLRVLYNFVGATNYSRINPSASNVSRRGTATVATYRALNAAYNNKMLRSAFRVLSLTPRKLIQGNKSPLWKVTEALSRSSWSSNDVRKRLTS